jgi:hypothetical protein
VWDWLQELRWHWGSAYVIAGDIGSYTATRRDTGAVLRADTPNELYDVIRQDYMRKHVPRR